MNNVNLIGRIATDVKTGSGVASSLLAVKRIYHSKDGQDTDFIPISIFGKQAENFQKMVEKGQQIGLDGRIKTSTYADENGEKKYGWSVAVDHFYLLNSGKHDSKDHKSDNENVYTVDKQLSNLDKILDTVKADEQQPEAKLAKQPVKQADESISPIPPLGNKNNRSHISGNDFSKSVIDNQPSVEALQQEIKDLKKKALPF
ncbi:single-stranded DNA-binding protein [Schleiferilactobacillus harbinensis]|uniref:single-stranded DNA-binding protein n=1 Tax=Schleiferilactobacillus harbinensis TaxID=304207 RepID=UPI0007BA13B1|nr:single-stranded DNA-binding protein [Schleiferilactobacillus harbinensis]